MSWLLYMDAIIKSGQHLMNVFVPGEPLPHGYCTWSYSVSEGSSQRWSCTECMLDMQAESSTTRENGRVRGWVLSVTARVTKSVVGVRLIGVIILHTVSVSMSSPWDRLDAFCFQRDNGNEGQRLSRQRGPE